MKIYIAGKITGNKRYKEQFAAAERECRELGAVVLSPATLPEGMTPADYMDICFAMIRTADLVVFLSKSENSKGAMLEMEYCDYIKKPHVVLGGGELARLINIKGGR